MNKQLFISALVMLATLAFTSSCVKDVLDVSPSKKRVGFNISVTREGETIAEGRVGRTKSDTKGAVDESSDRIATMDKGIPFGLVGIDYEHNALVLDNVSVHSDAGQYSAFLGSMLWDNTNPETVTFSAYYPFVESLIYEDNYSKYSIPYTVEATSAGPLVSKTVEAAISQLNSIPLEFQHITNDIGYCICDVTPDPGLQGLVHLRKMTAYNVASAGVFDNELSRWSVRGSWKWQGYYRDIVVFEGDAKVGVGSQNEKFVGFTTLEDRLADSHRYYSVPDEIEMGKQFVEVVFDVEGFTVGDFYYKPIEGAVMRYALYGLLPDNIFVYGRQYTFHIGIDLSSIYKQITFAASVAGWETKIYENNDVF